MAVMTSFHTEKCCHLMSKQGASAGVYAVAHKFLIYSTFVLVLSVHTGL